MAETTRTTEEKNGGKAVRGLAEPALLGQRLRDARERQRVGLRTLAKHVGVSPSLISQVERGRVMPSVATLYSIVTELGLSLDELFLDENGRSERHRDPEGPVQRHDSRKTLQLASGVRWERLTPQHETDLDFQYARYEVGAESCPAESLMRHGGKEYGYVVEGKLGVTIGYESYELEPGDSVSFQSTLPHRLWNAGKVPAVAIWLVVGRDSDHRVGT